MAQRGKSSTGWFFGFKLHLIINDRSELLGVRLTPGNVDDRLPVPEMAKGLFGKLFGDRGYISPSATPHPPAARRRVHHQATQEHETQAVEPDGQNPSQEEGLD